MTPTPKALRVIKQFEGIRDGDPSTVNLDPYLCAAGYATIGWGHVVTDGGRMLHGAAGLARARQLYPQGITMQEAEALLEADVSRVAQDVTALTLGVVGLTQDQFDALVSFAFNVGTDMNHNGIAEGLGDSTLLTHVKAGRWLAAADEFPKWNKATVPGKGFVELAGLTNRRRAERALFLGFPATNALGLTTVQLLLLLVMLVLCYLAAAADVLPPTSMSCGSNYKTDYMDAARVELLDGDAVVASMTVPDAGAREPGEVLLTAQLATAATVDGLRLTCSYTTPPGSVAHAMSYHFASTRYAFATGDSAAVRLNVLGTVAEGTRAVAVYGVLPALPSPTGLRTAGDVGSWQ